MRLLLILLLVLQLNSLKADEINYLLKIPSLEVYKLKNINRIKYLSAKKNFRIGINNNISCNKATKESLNKKFPLIKKNLEKYDTEFLENSCESDKLKWEENCRLVLEPEMKDRLYPRLLPQSPAGTVSKIISNNHALDILNPIIKEVYNKDVTNANSQCISSTFWDYDSHVDAFNVYNENIMTAYWDECFEQGEKCLGESSIADPHAWEDAKTWVKQLRECDPRTFNNTKSINSFQISSC